MLCMMYWDEPILQVFVYAINTTPWPLRYRAKFCRAVV